MALIDSYAVANVDNYYTLDSNAYGVGQSFTGNGKPLGRIALFMGKTGSPTGTCFMVVKGHTGTYGTSSGPTATTFATSQTVDTSTFRNAYDRRHFVFDGTFTPVNGTRYVFELIYNAGTVSNYLFIGVDSSSPTHAGNAGYRNTLDSWTASSTTDVAFEVEDTAYRSGFMAFF